MAVTGNEIFRSINLEEFCGFRFLFGRPRIRYWRNVMEYEPRIPALPSDNGSAIQPYRFLFFGTMIRNGRYDQVIQHVRRSVRDNLWFSSELDEPLIYGARSVEIWRPALS
jgi:hypothetical protein